MFSSPQLDTTVPAVVFKICRNALQHGPLAVIRSLGRAGVPVYSRLEDRFTPASHSRYSAGRLDWRTVDTEDGLLGSLSGVAKRMKRPAVLIATDDLAAEFIAEHTDELADSFLFPRVPRNLPRRLANKRDLAELCRGVGVPNPSAVSPKSLEDVYEFIGEASFPVVVKVEASQVLRRGMRSVAIANNAEELLDVYRQTAALEVSGVLFQDYIPPACAEDWIFHEYVNPESGCSIAFTGKKLRSYPTSAGPTTLGLSAPNASLMDQGEKLLRAIGYAGIVDIDFRLDRRDGGYKVLDFNPRVGANFRMFQDRAGVDVVRAMHLDLTGRAVGREPMVDGNMFIVEPYDTIAAIGFLGAHALTIPRWWQSIHGRKELAWFNWDDPLPFFTMLARLSLRFAERTCETLWSRLRAVCSRRPDARQSIERPEINPKPAIKMAKLGGGA